MMFTSKLLGGQGSKSPFSCETKLEQPLPCALDCCPAGSMSEFSILAYNWYLPVTTIQIAGDHLNCLKWKCVWFKLGWNWG